MSIGDDLPRREGQTGATVLELAIGGAVAPMLPLFEDAITTASLLGEAHSSEAALASFLFC